MKHLAILCLAIATGLLLTSLSACSKKEEAAPIVSPSGITAASKAGIYKVDGQLYGAPATYTTAQLYNGGLTQDVIYININSKSPSLTQSTQLSFSRPAGAVNTDYQLNYIDISTSMPTFFSTRHYDSSLKGTITKTANGYYSGTFSGTSNPNNLYTTTSIVTEGSFTDAQP